MLLLQGGPLGHSEAVRPDEGADCRSAIGRVSDSGVGGKEARSVAYST